MGSFSIWHWLIVLVVLLILVVLPLWWGAKVLRKAGHHRAWTLLQLVPLVNIVAIFVFAFTDWPVEKQQPPASPDAGFEA